MAARRRAIDLHVHTHRVGRHARRPAELARRAARSSASRPSRSPTTTPSRASPSASHAAPALGVACVPAVELSDAHADGRDVHILGYFVDPDDPALLRELARLRAGRVRTDRDAWSRALSEAGFAPPTRRRARASRTAAPSAAATSPARSSTRGHASDLRDAFERLIGNERPVLRSQSACPARPRRSPSIRAAGGVAVLAHPGVSQRRGPDRRPRRGGPGAASRPTTRSTRPRRRARLRADRGASSGSSSPAAPTTTGLEGPSRRHGRASTCPTDVCAGAAAALAASRARRDSVGARRVLPCTGHEDLLRPHLRVPDEQARLRAHRRDARGRAGCRPRPTIEDADVIVFNTCSVRENAEERLRGQVAILKPSKAGRPGHADRRGRLRRPEDAEGLAQALPHVDVVFGTHNLEELPALLDAAAADVAHEPRCASWTAPTTFASRPAQPARAAVERLAPHHGGLRQPLQLLHRARRARAASAAGRSRTSSRRRAGSSPTASSRSRCSART